MSRFRTRKIRGLCRPQHLPRLRQRALEALEELVHHVGRHPVADCRVGAPAVVVGLYGADHGEDRLLARGKRVAAIHLASEGREEGLCRRVVVAADGAAARELHVVFPSPRRQQPRGVLAVAVAWKMALRPCGRACEPARGPRRLCRRSCARTHVHPTTMRVLRSTTVARDSQPCPVRR